MAPAFAAVAVDAQGPETPRRFADHVSGSFDVLVDPDNVLGERFGFKAIPNGIFVSREGRVDAIKAGKFDIRRPESRDLVDNWLADEGIPIVDAPEDMEWSQEARDLFLAAGAAIRRGERGEAIRLLKLAFPLEPDNLIIRKQLWAIEHPERFYSGDIDRDWQRDQLAMGR